MKQTIKISLLAVIAMFAFNTVADAQKWAYQADFVEGRACVKDKNGKWGFIDESGKVIVPCTWRDVKHFKEGLAPVENQDELYGYVDLNGKLVIPCQWENAYSFERGVAKVQIKLEDYTRVWKKIDKTGKFIE